jgi:hypothetical protein
MIDDQNNASNEQKGRILEKIKTLLRKSVRSMMGDELEKVKGKARKLYSSPLTDDDTDTLVRLPVDQYEKLKNKEQEKALEKYIQEVFKDGDQREHVQPPKGILKKTSSHTETLDNAPKGDNLGGHSR